MVEISKYADRAGHVPFDRWFSRLRDPVLQSAVLVRLRRLSLGLAGDSKSVGAGVRELRVHIGPGYRIYFVWEGPNRVMLLGAGSKATQSADVAAVRDRLARHRDETKR